MTGAWIPLTTGHGANPAILVVLTLAAALTAVVAGLAIAAFVRRRSRPFLLVALALSALLARTVLGVGAYASVFGVDQHHLLEHGLDVVMAALVIAAVYLVRRPAGDDQPAVSRPDGGKTVPEAGGERTGGGLDRVDRDVDAETGSDDDEKVHR